MPSASANMPAAQTAPALDLAEYRTLQAFRLSLRRFLAFSENAARAAGVTPQQHQALLAIKAHEGAEAISVGELAQALLIKNHSALGLVGRLAERGFVTRRPSRQDRRRVLLQITPQASDLLETISRQNLRELSAAAPVLAQLLGTLERLEDRDQPICASN